MSFTKQNHRLVTREQLYASQAAWTAGRFSDEWKPWRNLAALQAGIIVPPEGSAMDQWDDEKPSERAQIIRAIRETPKALRAAICAPNVHSWSAVIAQLVRRREDVARDLDLEDAELRREKARATAHQDTYRLREILDVIGQS